MRIKKCVLKLFTVIFVMTAAMSLAQAQGRSGEKVQIGLRGNINLASGEPANDMIGYGIYGRYRLNQNWLVGAAVDIAEYDFERPAKILGIPLDKSAKEIDAGTTSTIVSVWGEYEFDVENNFFQKVRPFAGAGVGIGLVSVDDLTAPAEEGGSVDISTDAGTEIVPGVTAGLRYNITKRLIIEGGVRADYHIADWKVKDRISGRTGTIDDYETYGGYLGVGVNF